MNSDEGVGETVRMGLLLELREDKSTFLGDLRDPRTFSTLKTCAPLASVFSLVLSSISIYAASSGPGDTLGRGLVLGRLGLLLPELLF